MGDTLYEKRAPVRERGLEQWNTVQMMREESRLVAAARAQLRITRWERLHMRAAEQQQRKQERLAAQRVKRERLCMQAEELKQRKTAFSMIRYQERMLRFEASSMAREDRHSTKRRHAQVAAARREGQICALLQRWAAREQR